ncbi:MAG: hypothetical protein KC420_05930 [Myxococcales bacterium]|nr:hypothetical protein [Myxococcales bacterium]MCB9704655.1 hypothetical protein [Myxococcales bacterium]
MRRPSLLPLALLAALVAPLGLAGCAGKGAAAPTPIFTDTVEVGAAKIQVEFTHETPGKRQVLIKLKMRNLGMEETEKLVADVHVTGGFNIEEGSTHWEGFVPPRQPQTFTVRLVVPEGHETASATVTLLRSLDSLVLVKEDVEFTVSEGGAIKPAS